MVKFGRPRGKLEDERRREFLRKSVGGGEGEMVAEAGVREKEKGNERSSTRGPRVDGVLRKREQEGDKRQRDEH